MKLHPVCFAPIASALLLQSPLNFSFEEDSPWYLEFEVNGYQSNDSDDLFSIIAYSALLMYSEGDTPIDFFTYAYYDDYFKSLYFGISREIGDYELALGVGPAEYDDKHWTVLNPWLYYDNGVYEVLLYGEYTLNESSNDRWFYKAHIYRSFYENWFAGIYGERFVGLGPLIGYNFSEKISMWFSTPVMELPDEDKTIGVMTVNWAL